MSQLQNVFENAVSELLRKHCQPLKREDGVIPFHSTQEALLWCREHVQDRCCSVYVKTYGHAAFAYEYNTYVHYGLHGPLGWKHL